MKGLPSFDDIVLTGTFGGDHRSYTHLGWRHRYTGMSTGDVPDWDARWLNRKKLLQQTVGHVFDFGLVEKGRIRLGFVDGTHCDAMAELVYCVHILGDLQDTVQENIKAATDYGKSFDTMIPYAAAGDGSDGGSFCTDLEDALATLFDTEKTREDYQSLLGDIETLAADARMLGDIRTKAAAESLRANILKLRQTLKGGVPPLLRKAEFFSAVFG